MAKSLGMLSLDLVAKIGGFTGPMDKAKKSIRRDAKDIGDSIKGIATTTSGVAAGLAGATAAVIAFTNSAAQNARSIENQARLANATAEEMQKWGYAVNAVGLSSEKLSDILKDVNDKVGDFLSTGGGEMKDFFETIAPQVGVTADQFRRLSGPQALQLYYTSLEKANLTQSEMIFYLEAIANDASALAPLLKNNGEQFSEWGDQAERLGIVLGGLDLAKLTDFANEFDRSTQIASSLSSVLAAELAPYLSVANTRLIELAESADGFNDSFSMAIRKAVEMIGPLLDGFQDILIFNTQVKVATGEMQLAFANFSQGAWASFGWFIDTALAGINNLIRGMNAIPGFTDLDLIESSFAGSDFMARINEQAEMAEAAILSHRQELDDITSAPLPSVAISNYLDDVDARIRAFKAEQEGFEVKSLEEWFLKLPSLAEQQEEISRRGLAAQNELAGIREKSLSLTQQEAIEQEKLTKLFEDMAAAGNAVSPEEQNRLRDYISKQFEDTQALSEARRAQSDAARQAAKVEREYQKALESSGNVYAKLFAEMSPAGEAQADYNATIAELQVALNAGTKSTLEYYAAVAQAAKVYNEAVAASDPYAKELKRIVDQYDSAYQRGMQLQRSLQMINQAWRDDPQNGEQYARVVAGIRDEIEQLALEADPLAQEMARLWEEAGERIDETFADAFRGAFDSFSSFSDQLADGFKRLLGELAYQATLKPIVVAFTGDMQGMLGGGSGGFGNTIGAARSLFSSSSSLIGGGSAAAGGLYGNVATSGYTSGFAANATSAGATVGGGGFLSSAASMAGPIAAMYAAASLGNSLLQSTGTYDALGIRTDGRSSQALGQIMPIGGTIIGSALDALGIGGRSRGPSFDLMTTDRDPNTIFEDVQHGVKATGAFGNVGFHGGNTNRLEETFGSFDNATQFLEAIAATDNMIASLAPDDVDAMTHAIQQMRLKSSDAAGIADQLGNRTKAAFGAMSGDFGAFARTLTGSTEEIIAQAQTTQQAHALLTSASERLGLQFNIAGGYAYEAAQDIAQLAGGVENLSALQQSYYQNFFTEAERAAHLTADLTSALGIMGLQLPETREGFRQLVEAQDLSTESGRQAYAQLLQLSASFSELTPAVEAAGDAASDTADALREREQLERQLLTLQGNTAELRRRDLDALDSSNRGLQQRIWALEDEQEAQRKAEKAQAERIRAIEQEANAWQRAQQQLASFGVSIDNWIDNLRGTDAGLGTPGDQLAAASAAFDEQYAKAMSGDQAALGSITQYADRFIEAQKGWSASGEQTVSTIDRVTGMLERLPDQLTPEQFLAEEFKGIIDGQTAELLSGWNGGFDSLLSGLSADFGALDTSLDGLLSFDELKAGLAGKATDSELRALIGAVDKNGDGLISRQELTNATISDLRLGITSTLSKSFSDLDSNVDGLLTFGELKAGLGGIATDAQLKAMMQGMDLNNDSVVDKLESVVVSAMPTDGALTNVLRNQMQDLRTKTLTSSQVRAALRPIATDAEIENLIKRVDANGDGIISEQELANSRLDSLSQGIAGALEPMFSSIDLDASGLIDYNEFGKAFEGMATDEQLKNIFSELDRNGDGVISALEAVRRSSMDTEGSIKTIEDFFYRAGSPSWGLRVSMSHHQNVDAVKSFGYHTAKEMRREFSPSGTGIGVSLAAPQNGDGARSIATAFKQILGPNRVDGSHASGAWNIGFDGYLAELHKGEMVVPAGPADALRELAAGGSPMSMASMPAPAVTMSAPPLPQFPLLDQTDVTQVMRDMQRTIEQKNEQIVELLKEVRGNTGQTRDAVMGVGKGAHQQREQQSRQLDRLNRNTKEKVRTP